MAWDPRITAYQIPYQPLFETTKQEIERSLLALEEKLRRVHRLIFRGNTSTKKSTKGETAFHRPLLSPITTTKRSGSSKIKNALIGFSLRRK
jgi:hypothetical protein